MICPKCGFEQAEAEECARCGIVFDKLKEPSERVRPGSRQATAATAQPRRAGGKGGVVLAVCLLCAVGVLAYFEFRRTEAPGPAPAAGVTPAPSTDGTAKSAEIESPLRWEQRDGFSSLPSAEPPKTAAGMPSQSGTQAPTEGGGTLPKVVSPMWYTNGKNYGAAVSEHQLTGAPMAVYFFTDWCPYCKRLDNNILAASEVREFLMGVVKVRLNPESGLEEENIARHYGIRGYPSFLIIAAPGAMPRMVRPFSTENGRSVEMSPAQFVQACREVVSRRGQTSAGSWAPAVTNPPQNEPQNAEEYHRRGVSLARSGDEERAEKDFAMAMELDPSYAEAYESLARLHYQAGRTDDAIDDLTRLIRIRPEYKNGQAYYFRATIYKQRGEADEAMMDAKNACSWGHQQGCQLQRQLQAEQR